jgi:hypothetical protein
MQLNGSAVLAAALQKKMSRKRKGISLESEVINNQVKLWYLKQ